MQRFGDNNGDDIWQHDLYNAGGLVEAAVHHDRATGKTSLLALAARFAKYMCTSIGPGPRKNRMPGHRLPEEASVSLIVDEVVAREWWRGLGRVLIPAAVQGIRRSGLWATPACVMTQ